MSKEEVLDKLFKIWVIIGLIFAILLVAEFAELTSDMFAMFLNAPIAHLLSFSFDIIYANACVIGLMFAIDYLVKKGVF